MWWISVPLCCVYFSHSNSGWNTNHSLFWCKNVSHLVIFLKHLPYFWTNNLPFLRTQAAYLEFTILLKLNLMDRVEKLKFISSKKTFNFFLEINLFFSDKAPTWIKYLFLSHLVPSHVVTLLCNQVGSLKIWFHVDGGAAIFNQNMFKENLKCWKDVQFKN